MPQILKHSVKCTGWESHSMATRTSKMRKFVTDGVFYAELNEVLTRELAVDGYSGMEVRIVPMRVEAIIVVART
ncbi:CitMHS domain-containing protein [Psidium guajava]|nr:CitMHS domain-containing protein [Psidium guajava]